LHKSRLDKNYLSQSRKAAKVFLHILASLRDYLTILPIYFKALIQKAQVTIKKPSGSGFQPRN
jgi:hypothetical protein